MGILKDNSIIHESSNADFSNYVYTQVYAGDDASVDINGTTVTMKGGSIIDIRVKSISSTANIYVIGNPINTLYDNPILG